MIFKEVKLERCLFRGGGAGATMDPEAFLDMANQVFIIIITITIIEIVSFIKIISSMEINNATICFYVGPSPHREVEAELALIIIVFIIATIIIITIMTS